MNRLVIFISLTFALSTAYAQQHFSQAIFTLPDSVRAFTLDDLYEQISKNHPIISQVKLLSEVAKQEIRYARGNFDPKLESQYLTKESGNKTYYELFEGSLRFPTRTPVTPEVGVQKNNGAYLNPENYIADKYNNQQIYTGITIPLAQGLLTDERRTALKQAQLFGQLMEAEQVKIINKLLLEAAKDYWNWYYAYYNYRIAVTTTNIGEEIFRRVKMNFAGGEAALVDTVQAKITLLERQVARQEARNQFTVSSLKLSNHLWDSLNNPLQLPEYFAPPAGQDHELLSLSTLDDLVVYARENHPELRKLKTKQEQLQLEQNLAKEFLKPRLNISYYMLNQPFAPGAAEAELNLRDNYKLAVDLSIPLLLRKERAKVAQTRIKILSTSIDQEITAREITNEINTAYNYLVTNDLVIKQQQEMVKSYYQLLSAELINLENGESDLFKIGLQQEKLFNAQSKLVKTLAEYGKQKALLLWSAGLSSSTALKLN